MLQDLFAGGSAWPLAAALKGSRYAYPIVNAIHIMAIGTLFGAILALDLRLLGVARSLPVKPLALYLPRVAGCGLAIAILTGLLLFLVQPLDYIGNRAFIVKISLVGLGVTHALAVHVSDGWRQLVRGSGEIGRGLRISAALSLTLWVAAILAGRFIAF